ncbi:MAG: hypothetical protein MHMPM18_002502 [Marteilia pararefringens]
MGKYQQLLSINDHNHRQWHPGQLWASKQCFESQSKATHTALMERPIDGVARQSI